MIESPALNLVMFVLLSAAAGLLFWPRHGVIPRLRRERRMGERVLVEDALKHVFHQESRGQTCTLDSVGGALEIGADSAFAVVERMRAAGLVRIEDGRILLAEEGNRYALQIIRAHRLWERYLADETGVDPVRWHAEAERYEHTLSPDDAEALSARLGHPSFDPHGDPIPTADGKLLQRDFPDLSSLAAGDRAQVVHVEDEPDVAYRRILELGIFPGMMIRVVEASGDGMIYEAAGNRFELPPLVARNITVALPGAGAPEVPDADGTMGELETGDVADVVRISPACRGAERRRLMDLGIVPGTRVKLERSGVAGGLRAYRVRGTVVALRSEQAQMISVRRVEEVA